MDNTLLGNPLFVSKYNYQQDFVKPLYQYTDLNNLKASKQFVDLYFNLVQQFIRYGFFDYTCKFKDGYGVTLDGKLICIDFNEVTFSKKDTIELISQDVLVHEAQFTKLPAGESKEYIRCQFRERITIDYVQNHWGIDLK